MLWADSSKQSSPHTKGEMRHRLLFLGGETGAERALVRARAHPISLPFPVYALRSRSPPQLSLTNAVGFSFPPSTFFFYMLIGGEAAVSWSPWCEIIYRLVGGFYAKGRVAGIEAGGRPAQRPSLGWWGRCRNTRRKNSWWLSTFFLHFLPYSHILHIWLYSFFLLSCVSRWFSACPLYFSLMCKYNWDPPLIAYIWDILRQHWTM